MPKYELVEGVDVVVYGRPGCTDCNEAEKVLKSVQVPYTHKNVKEDVEAQTQVTSICAAFERGPAVPVIVIHHQTSEVNGKIVFIEPRRLGLQALASTLLAFRMPTPRA